MAKPHSPIGAISLGSIMTAYVLSLGWHEGRSPSRFLATAAAVWLLLLLAWAVWAAVVYPKYVSPLRHLPGPQDNHWLMGQWHRIKAHPTGVPLREWNSTIPNDGLIRYLGIFNQERLLVTSARALSEVLTARSYDFVKPAELVWTLGRLLGRGVLLTEGDEHRAQRRGLLPAFAFRHIKDLYPLFWAKSGESVRAITAQIEKQQQQPKPQPVGGAAEAADQAADGPVIEVYHWASRVALDLIGAAGLGRDFGAVRDPDNHLSRTYQHLFRPTRQTQILIMLGNFIPGWLVDRLPVRRNRDIRHARAVLEGVCNDLIREKREKLAKAAKAAEAGDSADRDLDILSVAIESGAFTEDNLTDQLLTFLAAGHETTASALVWTLYELCIHPEMQTRLRDEVRAHLPPPIDGHDDEQNDDSDGTTDEKKRGRSPAASPNIDGLPYLNAVCSEVLRYHPPVPLALRVAAKDTSVVGVRVPAGTRVMICPAATNRDPAFWGADSNVFNPERWLAGSAAGAGAASAASGAGAANNYAFLTFLGGPRSCIGMSFARAELAFMVAAWVGRFEFALQNPAEKDEANLKLKGGVTARPIGGLMVKVRVVAGW